MLHFHKERLRLSIPLAVLSRGMFSNDEKNDLTNMAMRTFGYQHNLSRRVQTPLH